MHRSARPMDVARADRIAARLMLGVITLLLSAVEWIAEAVVGGGRVCRWAVVTGQVGCVGGRSRS